MSPRAAAELDRRLGTFRIDLTGERFGRLYVQGYAGKANNGSSEWVCVCDCGKTSIVNSSNLKRGRTNSCGCLRAEIDASRFLTHGQAQRRRRTPEYKSWTNMHIRCYNTHGVGYAGYGGRGITVCERWHSFELFFQDMGPKPSLKHTLDRWPNNDGNYEPTNCRWATPSQQARNRSTVRVVHFEGQSVPLVELCDRYCIDAGTVRRRLKSGWPLARAPDNSDSIAKPERGGMNITNIDRRLRLAIRTRRASNGTSQKTLACAVSINPIERFSALKPNERAGIVLLVRKLAEVGV